MKSMPLSPMVLLLRVNAYGELYNTREAATTLRRQFPNGKIVALTTPQSEGRILLENDFRLDDLILFPPDHENQDDKSFKAFYKFIRSLKPETSVVCVGATPGLDYTRAVVSLAICGGKRYILDASHSIHPAPIPLIAVMLLKATASKMRNEFLRRLWPKIIGGFRRLKSRRGQPDVSYVVSGEIHKILWIRLDGVGDAAMTLPALNALRECFPQAKIDVLARPLCKDFLDAVPGIDNIYIYEPPDAPKTTRTKSRQPGMYRFAAQLRKNEYDLAVDVAGRNYARLMAYYSGARISVSPAVSVYDNPETPNYSFLLTHPIPLQPDRERSAIDTFVLLVQKLGIKPGSDYRLAVSPEAAVSVADKLKWLGVHGGFAVIHARSGEPAKDWSPERFASVADYLANKHGLTVVLTGADKDQETNCLIRQVAQQQAAIFDATGLFSLSELPALLKQATIMVSVDTGPMHIAALVGTPLVALFLPWFVQRDQPYGQPDAVLTPFSGTTFPVERAEEFWQGRLLDGIRVEDVIAAMDRKLKAPPHD